MYPYYCIQKCGGIRRKVSKRIFQLHATFRQLESKIQQENTAPGPILNSVSFCIPVFTPQSVL